MRRLLLLALLLGCDVSRDLRPELFACDAGGVCPDAGVMRKACLSGSTCTCSTGESCFYSCYGPGDCTLVCEQGSTCDYECRLARCNLVCEMGANCNVACQTATCEAACTEGSDCTLDCPITSNCTCNGGGCP